MNELGILSLTVVTRRCPAVERLAVGRDAVDRGADRAARARLGRCRRRAPTGSRARCRSASGFASSGESAQTDDDDRGVGDVLAASGAAARGAGSSRRRRRRRRSARRRRWRRACAAASVAGHVGRLAAAAPCLSAAARSCSASVRYCSACSRKRCRSCCLILPGGLSAAAVVSAARAFGMKLDDLRDHLVGRQLLVVERGVERLGVGVGLARDGVDVVRRRSGTGRPADEPEQEPSTTKPEHQHEHDDADDAAGCAACRGRCRRRRGRRACHGPTTGGCSSVWGPSSRSNSSKKDSAIPLANDDHAPGDAIAPPAGRSGCQSPCRTRRYYHPTSPALPAPERLPDAGSRPSAGPRAVPLRSGLRPLPDRRRARRRRHRHGLPRARPRARGDRGAQGDPARRDAAPARAPRGVGRGQAAAPERRAPAQRPRGRPVRLHRLRHRRGRWISRARCARASSAIAALLRVAAAVCAGLAHAHEHGVVHRDVKPANVLLGRDGSVRVLDFGIASLDEPDATVDDRMLGTLSYMAPETCQGGRPTPATDVWAVGVMVYEALTGANPYRARTPDELRERHKHPPRSLGDLRPDLPRAAGGRLRPCARVAAAPPAERRRLRARARRRPPTRSSGPPASARRARPVALAARAARRRGSAPAPAGCALADRAAEPPGAAGGLAAARRPRPLGAGARVSPAAASPRPREARAARGAARGRERVLRAR